MQRDPQVLVDGLGLVESVRWARGSLWFSDWTSGLIRRVDPETGVGEVVAEVASLPLCFDLLDDELVVLDSASGWLLRGRPGGELRRWVEVGGVGRAGNEVLVAGDRVYLDFGNFDPRQGFPEQPVGSIAMVADDGSVQPVAESLAFPNGMALSPDGSVLVVAESHAGILSAWDVATDGALSGRRTWAAVAGSAPDGIGMAPDGTCWFADVGSQSVTRVREGGEVLEQHGLDRGGFSCAVVPEIGILAVAAARWPGGQRMFDPTHEWEGQLLLLPLAPGE